MLLATRRERPAALANIGVSALSCVLALFLFGHAAGEQGWTRMDAAEPPLVALSGLIGLTTAVFSAATIAAERFDLPRLRAYHAAFQVFMGAQFLALLSDNSGSCGWRSRSPPWPPC